MATESFHVSTIYVRAPFEEVWPWVTDPLLFPTIYPLWTSEVRHASEGRYEARGPEGDQFVIVPDLDRAHGLINFDIIDMMGRVERSRSRLFEVGDHCVLVHVAQRWEALDDEGWELHKRSTDADLERVRELIERHLS